MKWGMRVKRRRHLWKGLLAGALGGFAGSFAMSQLHDLLQRGGRIFPARQGRFDREGCYRDLAVHFPARAD